MITSTSNAQVKRIRSLSADPRERRRERMFVLEGVRLVGEALVAGADLRLALFVPEQLAATEAGQHVLTALEGQPGCFPATPQVLAAAADTVTPQGVVAVAAWPEVPPRPGLTLVLDGVQDPGNVGTLLRSAEAAGIGRVISGRGTADAYSPKVVRAAMGAHFYLPLLADVPWEQIGVELGDVAPVYAAVANATMPYYAADWKQPAALIIGGEANGVSQVGLASATKLIAIPMAGRAESLNAAVAGSIILFEALRQRSRGRT
ncbi:MAG: RNA methyltransferase [Chloroflexaceae bacterium]|nr:RNA methyltransferase [Chloroflexaceae bacterium]